jgi:hypothetical protein
MEALQGVLGRRGEFDHAIRANFASPELVHPVERFVAIATSVAPRESRRRSQIVADDTLVAACRRPDF